MVKSSFTAGSTRTKEFTESVVTRSVDSSKIGSIKQLSEDHRLRVVVAFASASIVTKASFCLSQSQHGIPVRKSTLRHFPPLQKIHPPLRSFNKELRRS